MITAAVVLLGAAIAGGGCTNVGYYSQSVRGHLKLMAAREPIDELVADAETPEALKARLVRVLDARDFAVTELKLPDNGSYRSYADLGRPYVLWNVVAAPEFSVDPESWCFLFVGCVSYRGYFDEADARAFAADLDEEGLDTYVGGVAAYSTLGRFADPVLNTMMHGDDGAVAALLFHELAHQRLYVKDDSAFNEAFATVVEEEGLRRWVARQPDEGLLTSYRQRVARTQDFAQALSTTRQRLALLYDRELSHDAMRAGKAAEFERLRATYGTLKEGWGGYDGYDRWFAQDLNNAHLAAVATYHRLVPAFRALLVQADHDIERFYALADELGELPHETRHERLDALLRDPEAAGR